MKPQLLFLLLIATSASAQINWAQFDLPPLPTVYPIIVHDIKFDQNGDAFIPMDKAGVFVFNGITQTFYTGDNVAVLQGRNITAVEVDQNNLKWFLDGNTLNLITFDGTTWTLVPQSIPAIIAMGWTLKIDALGNLWSVIYSPDDSSNIAKFDGSAWTFYNSLGTYGYLEWYLPLKIDGLGRLVWCDNIAMHWFDGINSDTSHVWQVNGNGLVSDFEIDSNNEVWIRISKGSNKLAHYNGSNWVTENLPFGSSYRTRIMLDDQGNFWAPEGNTLWKKTNGTWQSVYNNGSFFSTDIAVDPQQRWWFYPTDTLDDEMRGNYLTLLDQNGFNTISGTVYFDLNANGTQDMGEPPYRNQFVQLMPLNYYQITDDSGNYQFGLIDTAGTYDVTLLPSANWYISSSPQSYNITQAVNLEITSGINFGIAPNSFYDDAVAGLSCFHTKRGQNAHFSLSVYNNGTTLMSGEIQFDFDSELQYVSAEIDPDQINGNILTWNYSGLFPGESKSFGVSCYVPLSLNIGDILTSTVSVTPYNTDVDQSNNNITLQSTVVSAFDPNIKTVYPKGEGNDGIIGLGTTLLYTVEFQNIGNDTAHNVMIYDELDEDLDFTTLQVIGNSHTYEVSVIEDHVLRFNFPDIMLPDSGINEAASHGFIQYRVKPFASCPLGTVLTNEASIVFDFNEPVVTNTTINTLGEPTTVNELAGSSSAIEIYPNPFSASTTISFSCEEDSRAVVTLYDLAGRNIKTLLDENLHAGNQEAQLNRDQLSSGIYFLQLKWNDEVVTRKLVLE